jgi:hypothetical protein
MWFVSKEKNASTRRNHNDLIELELKIAIHFGFLMPLNHQAKKGGWLESLILRRNQTATPQW